MRIDLNGEPVATEAATLAALIAERGHDPASVATALDGRFVARDRRATTGLTAGAKIEILEPMQGG